MSFKEYLDENKEITLEEEYQKMLAEENPDLKIKVQQIIANALGGDAMNYFSEIREAAAQIAQLMDV